jgi:tyrosyl-tRNA synthetase
MKLRDDWEFRGLVHQSTDDEILDRLTAGGVTAYIGFDPSAASLHLGHLMQLCTLRRLQISGNRPIALAGGGIG